MKSNSIHVPPTIIIGNKPYNNINLNELLNRYEEENTYRCNMSLPGHNNGTKHGNLTLCNHLYERLITSPLKKEDFIEYYRSDFKEIYMIEFLKNFKFHQYRQINYLEPRTDEYNIFLKSSGCKYTFSQRPRTGYTVLFEHILANIKNIHVSNFSIIEEPRETYYCINKNNVSICHNEHEEFNILKYLHRSGIIDASLCLLADDPTLTFLTSADLEPSGDMIKESENCYGQISRLTHLRTQT